jgi:predicted AlkP superfamily phosphohydrolase/phosphomutase
MERTVGASARILSLVGGAVLASTIALQLAGQVPARRAILVSFDGFSEPPMRQFSDAATSPVLWSMFNTGACAEASRTAFPSVTPTGHASIFTGAYANVDGIAAQQNGKLPLPQTTILDWIDGYSAEALRAEPIWIAAARQGLRVFSHMATQSPGAPGYPDVDAPTEAMARARASAAATLRRPEIGVINVYNEKIADASAFSADSNPSRVASGWRGMPGLGRGTAAPRELSWALGAEGDSLHALFYVGRDGRGAVVVSSSRDARRGVVARLVPTDTSAIRGRPLARYFSAPLRVDLARGRRTFVFFRLFELAPDLSRYLLYASETRVIHANRAEVAASYDSAVHGTPGNGSDFLLQRGRLGPIAAKGGDGAAEFRYLETSELLTRQFMLGTEWGWRTYKPQLEVDYLPQPDEALHTWYGYAHPSTPGVSREARANAAAMLARAYALVDLRLAQYKRLASETPGTMLFVTGEHGMRPTWARFKPNVVLHDAGLVALDAAGQIDLTHTLAAATDGKWISVNRATRKNGIVPEDSVSSVLDRVERALRAARDSAGRPIVTATWRAGTPAGDSLGLGPPAGGDLYYGIAPGFYPSAATRAPAVSPMPFPQGEHGFPSVDRDMQPAFCALGGDAVAHRYGMVRSIDIAPTVSDWLGIQPPADARGRSVLPEIRRRAPR